MLSGQPVFQPCRPALALRARSDCGWMYVSPTGRERDMRSIGSLLLVVLSVSTAAAGCPPCNVEICPGGISNLCFCAQDITPNCLLPPFDPNKGRPPRLATLPDFSGRNPAYVERRYFCSNGGYCPVSANGATWEEARRIIGSKFSTRYHGDPCVYCEDGIADNTDRYTNTSREVQGGVCPQLN